MPETLDIPDSAGRTHAVTHAEHPGAPDDPPIGAVFRDITEDAFTRVYASGPAYFAILAAAGLLVLVGMAAWGFQIAVGIGLSGLYHPVMWGVFITNFTWWAGIAHAGTLLSALLYLFRAPFRVPFARSAEAMTVIAAVAASAFPIIHLGRPWRAYWLLPHPNQRDLWAAFRSPLLLDVFAITTYLVVSFLFFWMGLMPDLAILRDRSRGWRKTIYGLLSLGWEGTARQWKHYHAAYGVLAALLALLVFFHSGGAWNFSLGIAPGWHSSLLAPYFTLAAVFSGMGLLLVLLIPMRRLLSLEEHFTTQHLEQVARLMLAMSLALSFAYALEYFILWYGRDEIAWANLENKAFGAFAVPFWTMTVLNSVVPLAFFWPRARRSPAALVTVGLAANLGIWLDRFVVIAGSLARPHLPYAWSQYAYRATLVEWGIFLGSLGWFVLLYLLYVRYLPVLPISEIKRTYLETRREERALRAAEPEAAR